MDLQVSQTAHEPEYLQYLLPSREGCPGYIAPCKVKEKEPSYHPVWSYSSISHILGLDYRTITISSR